LNAIAADRAKTMHSNRPTSSRNENGSVGPCHARIAASSANGSANTVWLKRIWDKTLGHPKANGEKHADGSFRREFDNGLAVYNPLGNKPVTVGFPSPRTSVSTRLTAKTFQLDAGDGDLFLHEARK
jgi:hypothetical protein